MLSSAEQRELRARLHQYEGRVAHMYLDTAGKVTVGVGHLLATAADAQRLGFVGAAGAPASAADIAAEHHQVAALPPAQEAAYYRSRTRLALPDAEIDRLLTAHIAAFHRELRVLYADFDQFPPPARLALFDMVFNLGATRLRGRFPLLNAAVAKEDWQTAAVQCWRPQVQPSRNAYVRQLFLDAAAMAVTP